nr:SH3 domain-containing protein [Mesorhizobium sp.]
MLAALVLAFVGLAAFPVSASAATAYTTGTLNVRSGPGPGYARIATLPAGHRVTVIDCQGSWCAIRAAGIRGLGQRKLSGPRLCFPTDRRAAAHYRSPAALPSASAAPAA